MRHHPPIGSTLVMGVAVLALAPAAAADLFFWRVDAGNRLWSRSSNWSGPGGVPDAPADTVYVQGVTNIDPQTDLNYRIGQLVVRLGGNLYTGDGSRNNMLVVTAVEGGIGRTLITDSGSSLTVYRSSNQNDFDTDDLALGGGASLHVRGGKVQVDDKLSIGAGARVDGYGSIEISRQEDVNDPVNNGHVKAIGGTLQFWGHPDAILDLDGTTENGVVETADYSTLIIDLQIEPEFNGTMSIGDGGETQINHPWLLSSEPGSWLVFNGGHGDDRAVLSGEAVTLQGTVNVHNGEASLVAPVDFATGVDVTVSAGATMNVATFAYLDRDALFSGAGALVVDEGATLELDQDASLGIALRSHGLLDIADESMTAISLASLELGPTAQTEFTVCGTGDEESSDHLVVEGEAALDGSLDLVVDGQCTPAPGDEFLVVTAGSVVGEFAQVTGIDDVVVVYTEKTVTVVVPSGCPADLDANGMVDFDDLLAVLTAWGNAGGPEDLDGSGFVDFGDVLIVLGAWGPCD